MRKALSSLCPLSLLMANSCAMAALFVVFSTVERMDNSDPCLALWLICLGLCHVGLGIFLRRERSERAMICFCAVFFLLQLVLAFLLHGFFSSLMGVLISICMWLYSYFNCYMLNIEKPTAERYTKSFDLCSLVLVFLLFFCSVKELPMTTVLPLALSTLLCLMALVLVRGGEGRRGRSVLLSGGLVLAFGALAAAFVALASGGVQRLLNWLLGCVTALLGFVYRCINAVLLFLISLWPEPEYAPLPAPEIAGMDLSGVQEQSFELIDPQKLLIAMLGIGLAIAAVLVLLHIIRGRNSISGGSAGGERGLRRQRSSPGLAIVKAFKRLIKALRFKLLCLSSRGTAPGLFIEIESRSRKNLGGRGESESCREFLARSREAYPWAQAELEKLADAMDAICFGSGGRLSPAEISAMRRKIFNMEKE